MLIIKKNLSSGVTEQGPTRAWDMDCFSLAVKRKKFQRNSILKTKTGKHYLPTPIFNINRTHSLAGSSPISQRFNKLVTSVAAMSFHTECFKNLLEHQRKVMDLPDRNGVDSPHLFLHHGSRVVF